MRKIATIGLLGLGLVSCVPGAIVVETLPVRIGTGLPHTVSLYAMSSNDTGWRAMSMPQTERKLEAILQSLVVHVPGGVVPGGEVRIHPEASGFYGARATDTNDIYVNIGLLAGASSEDEVAFIIAHELAHIALAHNQANSIMEGLRNTTETLTAAASFGAALGIQFAGLDDEDFSDVMIGSIVAGQLTEIAATAIYTRPHELEADIFAADLMVAAGYDLGAVPSTFGRLENGNRAVVGFLEQSAQAIQVQAEALILTGDSDIIRSGIRDIVRQVGIQAARDLGRVAAHSHPPASVRNDNFQRHIRRDGAPPATGMMDMTTWSAWKRSTNIEAWAADMETVDEAGQLMAGGHASDARRLVSRAISRRGSQTALAQQLALSYFQGGNGSRARSTLRAIPTRSVISLDVGRIWARSEAESGNPSRAAAIADRMENQYGILVAQPIRVTNAVISGDAGLVQREVTRCADLPSQVSLQCRRIATGIDGADGTETGLSGIGNWITGARESIFDSN
ncbi:M48 family metalloprotease [Monaibacterium marinum]|uniref:M48 family metalloprotease n=1 Tax=Pontivivens marinum TaxID=1690039 RepID=UPI0015E0A589|nr:M48 family metalloprotease [Monaibacterium marinum]